MSLMENIAAYRAGIAFYKKQYDKAEELYKKICSKPNVSPVLILKYAYLEIYLGKKKACKELLDKVDYENLSDDSIKNTYKQTEGLYLWKNNELDKAIKIYEDLHTNYKNTSIYETLGYLYIVDKNYEKALSYNQEAYEYSNDNNVIIDNLAESYYFLGDYKKAKELYEKMLSQEEIKLPKFPEAYYYYGMILKNENNLDEASRLLKKALEMRESNLSILTHIKIKEDLNEINDLI